MNDMNELKAVDLKMWLDRALVVAQRNGTNAIDTCHLAVAAIDQAIADQEVWLDRFDLAFGGFHVERLRLMLLTLSSSEDPYPHVDANQKIYLIMSHAKGIFERIWEDAVQLKLEVIPTLLVAELAVSSFTAPPFGDLFEDIPGLPGSGHLWQFFQEEKMRFRTLPSIPPGRSWTFLSEEGIVDDAYKAIEACSSLQERVSNNYGFDHAEYEAAWLLQMQPAIRDVITRAFERRLRDLKPSNPWLQQ